MSLVYKYSRYDIAKNRQPEKKWHNRLMICSGCADRVGIEGFWDIAVLRSLPDSDTPGCMACGKSEILAEVKVSYEIHQKLKKIKSK